MEMISWGMMSEQMGTGGGRRDSDTGKGDKHRVKRGGPLRFFARTQDQDHVASDEWGRDAKLPKGAILVGLKTQC